MRKVASYMASVGLGWMGPQTNSYWSVDVVAFKGIVQMDRCRLSAPRRLGASTLIPRFERQNESNPGISV